MIARYTAAWFLLMVLAILNGAFREGFLKAALTMLPHTSDLPLTDSYGGRFERKGIDL